MTGSHEATTPALPTPALPTPSLTTCLLAGGLSGMVVDVSLFPLDTLKTRLQSKEGFWKTGAFSKLYRGLVPQLLVSAPNAALFFFSYEALKRGLALVSDADQGMAAWWRHTAASVGAEMSACVLRVPGEVVKQRRQVLKYEAGGTMWTIKSIYHSGGILAFYQGYGPTILREIPFACIQYPLYELLKAKAARSERFKAWFRQGPNGDGSLKPIVGALCGSVAGGIAAAATTPFDVLKTRIILHSHPVPSGGIPVPYEHVPNPLRMAIQIAREEGWAKLFSGIGPRVTWITIGGAIFFGAYEHTKYFLTPTPQHVASVFKE